MNSPFSDRSMIEDPARFFGRMEEKRQIFAALAASKPQCVAIIGDRRTGRSSLLKNVEQTHRQYLTNSAEYVFGYLDLSSDTCLAPNGFYAEAAQCLLGVRNESLTPRQFDDLLETHNPNHQRKFILLLDEFAMLQSRKEQFNDDFYNGLRSRANAGDLTYVLVSHISLDKIAAEHEFGSTFFGIFTHVTLGIFTHDEARSSITRTAMPQLTTEDFHLIARIVDHHYHPLKLNIVADLVWTIRNAGKQLPTLQVLEAEYTKQIERALGTPVSKMRRRNARTVWVQKMAQQLIKMIEWWFADSRYLLLVFVILIFLLLFGYVTRDQVGEWVGISPPTPVPIMTSVATPTP